MKSYWGCTEFYLQVPTWPSSRVILFVTCAYGSRMLVIDRRQKKERRNGQHKNAISIFHASISKVNSFTPWWTQSGL
jgi:hypothetical protein